MATTTRLATLGVAFLGLATFAGSSASAAIIDDFSGTLAPYTQTTVLDQDTVRGTSFAIAGGGLTATSIAPTAANQAEQTLFLRSDFALTVGNVLRIDLAGFGTGKSQDFAIAIASTATPSAVAAGAPGDTRSNYLFAGVRGQAGQFIGSGANPAAIATANALQAGNVGGVTITPVPTGLFIARTAVDVFALGYTNANGDTTVGSFTVPNANAVGIGNAIGFYTDIRAAGTLGTFDNLRIVAIPEPTTLAAIAGLGGVALRRRRRA